MIPKVIHYCWFGRNPLDEKAQKCIQSWRKYFPDYEIKQWDESNFDVSEIPFMMHAYQDKKWAFVSDVARLMIVYKYGGIYFDTDVEVVSSYDDVLQEAPQGFIGFETTGQVASGLGFGAEKGHPFLKKLIDLYRETDYCAYKDRLSDIACTVITTDIMRKNGLVQNNQRQYVCDFEVYPSEYFSPIDYHTGKLKRHVKTHSIHWYSATWKNEEEQKQFQKYQLMNRIFGRKVSDMMLGISCCMKREGIVLYCCKRLRKCFKVRKNEQV